MTDHSNPQAREYQSEREQVKDKSVTDNKPTEHARQAKIAFKCTIRNALIQLNRDERIEASRDKMDRSANGRKNTHDRVRLESEMLPESKTTKIPPKKTIKVLEIKSTKSNQLEQIELK
jgi:hypothetical protein